MWEMETDLDKAIDPYGRERDVPPLRVPPKSPRMIPVLGVGREVVCVWGGT